MPNHDAYKEAILADRPKGYWRLNEGNYDDRVADESGHGHHGTFVGRPILGEPGAILGSPNSSMSFVPDVFIEVPHCQDFSIQTSGLGLSIEVWFKPHELLYEGEGGKKYIHWLGKGEPKQMEWGFRLHSNDHSKRPKRISAYAWNPQGGEGAGAYYEGDSVAQGEWVHLVACFQHYLDPCSKITGVQLFVNGNFVLGPPTRGTRYWNEGYWSVVPRSHSSPLRFATRSATKDCFLKGGLDEIAIYPRVLTPEQIHCHYIKGMGG